LLAPAGADGLLYGLGMRFQAATSLPAGTLACFLCAMAGLLILRAIWGNWPES
jgi:hypothetical protein